MALNNILIDTISTSKSHINDPFKGLKLKVDSILHQVRAIVISKKGSKTEITRVFIPDLQKILTKETIRCSESAANGEDLKLIVAKFFLGLKQIIRTTRTIVVLSINSLLLGLPDLSNKLAQLSDTVLSIESFTAKEHSIPYEFKEFVAFLNVIKLQQYGLTAPFRPTYQKYGLKRDRRKLKIEPLHLPPEESRAFGTSGTDSQLAAKAVAQGLVDSKNSKYTDHSTSHVNNPSNLNPKEESIYGKAIEESSISINDDVVNINPAKSSLASAIAALKASREQANSSAVSDITPISISRAKNIGKATQSKADTKPPNIDF